MNDKGRYIQIAVPMTGEAEWLALREPLESGWLTQGPQVAAFERAFAQRHAGAHAVAVTSCTTALHLALASLGVGPGDWVAVPSFTWIATANVVEYCGASPLFCDSGPDDYNLAPADFAEKLTRAREKGLAVKAVIVPHLFGLTADMKPILETAQAFGLRVVEDAACAAGSAYAGRPAGGLGDIGCFSFHPRKIISTGEGGLCLTNDQLLADRMACLRNHGASQPEEERHIGQEPWRLPAFESLGFNYRMTDLQGALGLAQLARLDGLIAERRQWACCYNDELAGINWLQTPRTPAGRDHSWQSYVCLIDPEKTDLTRDEIMRRLHHAGIATRPGTHAIHELGWYRNKYGLRPEDFPVASLLGRQTIALPLHNKMGEDDYRRIIRCLREMA